MTGVRLLACVWLLTHTGLARSELQFLERREGGSVVLSCGVDQRSPPPYGVYLRRSWLRPGKVLFMLTRSEFTVGDDDDRNRTSVSGDPGSHCLNVTLSDLRPGDTDRYYCEFIVDRPSSEDERVRGRTEFFLLVAADARGSADIGLVQTCAGGSAVLPCLPPNGEGLVVEGVILQRQRGSAPVEMLYHSKRHHSGSPPSSSSSSSSSHFPTERVHLSSRPGPSGITYNLTLQQLQPEDSALYSCQLLVRGRSDTSSSLGRRVFFVSVQGGDCGCSSYSTLLYALSAAVAILLFIVLIGFVLVYQSKARRGVKSHPPAPIYEEMAGVKPPNRKLLSHHLEEIESSEYRNCPVKKSSPENQYESPSGALCSRT
ncbi:cd7 antigen-like [Trachinotus anak]|uniref:cd7 antigen-like n=1 Tax=Trachinotus anak TaxID=443729 RepID=UPI0039F1D74A